MVLWPRLKRPVSLAVISFLSWKFSTCLHTQKRLRFAYTYIHIIIGFVRAKWHPGFIKAGWCLYRIMYVLYIYIFMHTHTDFNIICMVSCITCYMQGIHMSVFSSVCLSVWVGLCSLKDEFGQTCSKDTSDSSLAGVRLDCYLVSDFITLATHKSASFSIKVLQSCSTPQAQVLTHADIRHLGALPYVFTGWIRAPPLFW